MKKFQKIDKINRILRIIGIILFAWGIYLVIAGNKGWVDYSGFAELGFYISMAPIIIYLAATVLYPLGYLYGKVPNTGEPQTIRKLLFAAVVESVLLAAFIIAIPHVHN